MYNLLIDSPSDTHEVHFIFFPSPKYFDDPMTGFEPETTAIYLIEDGSNKPFCARALIRFN